MRILCVAEKPSIARSITEILSGNQFTTRQSPNRYTKNFDFHYRLPPSPQLADFTVTSVLGHLTGTDFDEHHKGWRNCDPFSLFDAPINRFVNPDHKGIERNLKAESRRADKLIIWTDCDREGEHIGSEIVSVCRAAKPGIIVLRARFSAIIPAQIHNACQNAGELDMNQVYAVQARMELDLRIGAALTRCQTMGLQTRFHQLADSLISYGPCQFPTLGFVVDQYDKVNAFIPEAFWYIQVVLARDDSRVEFKWKRHRLFDYQAAFVLHEMCTDDPEATVKDVNIKPAVKWKPLPLTTVELQKAGSRLLHLTPKAVLDIAEKLYQKGLVSYPRTETDQFDREFDFMGLIEKQMNDPQWGDFATRLKDGDGFQTPRNGKKNDKAHPPIHPTAHANNLNPDEKRVYDFITRRYLACCSKNATGKTTTVVIDIADEEFTATGLVILERNYLEVYVYDKWSGMLLPDFQIGEKFMPTSCDLKEGTTTRPNLLTEADLVALMDRNGIGTDATIAEHIAKIIDRQYVFKHREGSTQYLVPSTLGIGLVEGYNAIGLDKSLSKPQLRRETEERMTLICEGARTKADVLAQTIDEYRDVFIRTRRAFTTIVDQVARYLDAPPGQDANPAEDGGDDSDSGGDGPRGGGRGGGGGGGGDGGGGGGGRNGRGGANPSTRGSRRGRGTRQTNPGAGPSRGNGRAPSSDDDSDEQPDGPAGGTTRAGRGARASTRAGRGTRGTRASKSTSAAASSSRNTTSAAPAETEDNAPMCKCGAQTVERSVVKDGPNKGRPFYACPKPQSEGSCGFQGWADEGAGPSNTTAGGSASKRRAGEASLGTPSSRRPRISESQDVLRCSCDLEAVRRVAGKDGANKGRAFWVCSKVSKTAQCKYFKWDDEREGGGAGTGGGSTTGDKGSCFKCGQQGHWSNECSNQAQSGSHSTQGSSSASNYTCFSCNQQGHLSTNCPTKGAGSGAAAGPSKCGQKCFRCNRAGHWATDCPSQDSGAPFSSGSRYKSSARGGAASSAILRRARKRGICTGGSTSRPAAGRRKKNI
ncbi:hypothetical protein PCANC_01400 [Puccinia coronata f. sp. avenae]|uniref:DNA topoisomerase n=1 Tax=Puccinia coronata f. sp. avenae TaxID=200324 RepID=A0A2N5W653_9BASI|nr:hypothetical protein PCANC_01400 [Puccinia coronata f. sp. avenae]